VRKYGPAGTYLHTHTFSVFLLLNSSSPPIRPLGVVTNVTYVDDRPVQST